jgi:hypothetical protein
MADDVDDDDESFAVVCLCYGLATKTSGGANGEAAGIT